VAARHVVIDGDYAMTLAVTGYPAEVAPGWLEPLTSYPGRLDVALHIEPHSAQPIMDVESSRPARRHHLRPPSPISRFAGFRSR
jgi:hypothetical protein